MAGLGIGISHSWSPRTQIGASVSAGRTFSRYQDAYQMVADVQFGRAMSRRWLMQLHGGSGFIEGLRVANRLPSGPQFQGGGSLVYKTEVPHAARLGRPYVRRCLRHGLGVHAESSRGLELGRTGQRVDRERRLSGGSITGEALSAISTAGTALAGIGRRVSAHTSIHMEYMRLSYGGQSGTSTRTRPERGTGGLCLERRTRSHDRKTGMIRIFSQDVSPKTLVLAGVECALIGAALIAAAKLRFWNNPLEFDSYTRWPEFGIQALLFIATFQVCLYYSDFNDVRLIRNRREQVVCLGQSLGAVACSWRWCTT